VTPEKSPTSVDGSPTPSSPAKRKPPLDPNLLAFACELRQKQPDAEQLMWGLLRNRRLCGAKFRYQHPLEPYVLDFYCEDAKLAVELDGANTTPMKRAVTIQSAPAS
jgi:very-short-patch-repair endonuclease